MFRYRVKKFIKCAGAAILSLVLLIGVRVGSLSRFSALEGERVFFLHSASSQGLRVQTLSLKDIGKVKGECVHFDLTAYEGGMYALNGILVEEFAQSIAKKYNAEIVMTEDVCGVSSFYAYTNLWKEAIYVNGRAVNLHIAVNGTACAVGYPIIFDGY